MGVNMAVEAVFKALKNNSLRPVYTYGPLIHNPAALEQLAGMGVEILTPPAPEKSSASSSLPDNFGGRTVVIRAHGIPPAEYAELERRGAVIVNATCPRVLSSQKRAEKYRREGIHVILAGDRNHAEITGIAGFVPECTVLENIADAENYIKQEDVPGRAALIGQTTIKQTEYDGIAGVLKGRIPMLEVCPTICPAAEERQKALEKLAAKTEGIIVIGGKNSANTRRLFTTALNLTGKAWLIERPDDIPEEVFNCSCIGITAGASTPEEIISSVEKVLLDFQDEE